MTLFNKIKYIELLYLNTFPKTKGVLHDNFIKVLPLTYI